MLVMDVDGVLTDTRIWFDGKEWRRFFSIRDGVGIKLLAEHGYRLAIITGSRAEDIRERAKSLGVHHFYEGALDKIPAFEKLVQESQISPDEMAYIGDDIFDLPLIDKVGIGITVPEAVPEVLEKVKNVTKAPGGMGAVREVCDLILKYGAYAKEGPA